MHPHTEPQKHSPKRERQVRGELGTATSVGDGRVELEHRALSSSFYTSTSRTDSLKSATHLVTSHPSNEFICAVGKTVK